MWNILIELRVLLVKVEVHGEEGIRSVRSIERASHHGVFGQ